MVEPDAGATRLTLTVTIAGPIGRVGWLMTKELTKRYVETEAASVKRAAEEEGPG